MRDEANPGGVHQADSMARRLLASMESWGASDLFLAEGRPPSARIAGEVRAVDLPATTAGELDALLDEVLTARQRARFVEHFDIDAGYALADGRRFRFNFGRQRGRTFVTARAIPPGEIDLASLGHPAAVIDLSREQRGLVLVTGATGAGKSTTVAGLIHEINRRRRAHIVTIEDPIEFVHADFNSRITQREVGADTESFADALRFVLRQSPDVIVIGELRDGETVRVAIQAALTGHLVVASLHTIDVTQTLQRVMSLVPEDQRAQLSSDLASTLRGVVSQRLLPRADGQGRALALELLTMGPAFARLIREQRYEEVGDLMRNAADPSVRTFTRSVLELFKQGVVTHDVARAHATNPEEFALAAQGMATGVIDLNRDRSHSTALQSLDMKALLSFALTQGASDLHLAVGRPPILRIRGELFPLDVPPLSAADLRVLLFSVLTGRQRSTYELEREIDFALQLDDGQRFRINAYYQRGQMAAALRLISDTPPAPDKLGLPARVLDFAQSPQGLLLVVGPTGAGKTTTLASLVESINSTRSCRIITIEDPIEYAFRSRRATIDQREVHADTTSFSKALKYVLRQDPDVILVGEMRDLETISSALTAAETGHLVLATLHTNDAIQSINRIIDVFPAHQQPQVRSQLAAALLGVVSQRLLPRVDGSGRVAAFEVLVATAAIRAVIREDKMHQALSLMETSRGEGMQTMDRTLVEMVTSGVVSLEEAARHARNPKQFADQFEVVEPHPPASPGAPGGGSGHTTGAQASPTRWLPGRPKR